MDYTAAEDEGFLKEQEASFWISCKWKAYCALSPRADEGLFIEFVKILNTIRSFYGLSNQMEGTAAHLPYQCYDVPGRRIFVWFAWIPLMISRTKKVLHHPKRIQKAIKISEDQMYHFAGNMLQVSGSNNQRGIRSWVRQPIKASLPSKLQ